MHFGIGFEFSSLRDILEATQLAEAVGFDSCWIAEDYYFRGAFTIAAAVAARTNSLKIGTGVVNPYTRHPVLTAMEMAGLDELSGGRAFLGLGASEKFWMEDQLHIQYGKPGAALRDCVQIVRGVWRGDKFSYSGSAFQVTDVRLQIPPLRSQIPVYLGVVRQHNLALAGEIADGVLLPLMANPPYVRYAMEHLQRGAAKAGRSLKDFPVFCYLLASVDKDRTLARLRVKPILGKFLGYLKNHPVFTCTGHADSEIEPFVEAMRCGGDRTGLVSDWMIDSFAVAGNPKECREKLTALADAGVNGIIVFECAGTPARDTIQECKQHLLPAFA